MLQVRIDDIGASTKQLNQYGRTVFKIKNHRVFYFPLANFWFFKRIKPFKGWGPYNELTTEEWQVFLDTFVKYKIKPIIAITACWVDTAGCLVPFPEKFPEEAGLLKKAEHSGLITVANHGLTHCVVGRHSPLFWGSNRNFHREFWPWLDESVHLDHVLKSQKILEDYFEKDINIFVPPGNVWSKKTYQALKKTHINKVICNHYMLDSEEKMDGIEFVNDRKGFVNLHDRELKLNGAKWFADFLNKVGNI